jgi:hypothetical protein
VLRVLKDMNITPELSKRIKAILNEFVANSEPYLIKFGEPLDLRKVALDLHILPMLLDMGGCYALRPNGEIVSFAWNEPYDLEIENDVLTRNRVLFRGSKKYPELTDLVPGRPADAPDCPRCHGTGIVPCMLEIGLDPEILLCYCGGLGWVPKGYEVDPDN